MTDVGRYLVTALFVVGGVLHFVTPRFYLRMMPAYIPFHRAAVYVSGVCEFALGALLQYPPLSTWAAWGLIALLVAVFPANINMAMHPEMWRIKPALLWGRLPLQFVLMWWVYQYT